MAKVSKTLAEGKFRYINVLDIETEEEHERLYQKIKLLVSDPKMTVSMPIWSSEEYN